MGNAFYLLWVIPEILYRESICLFSDGFRLTTCRNDGSVLGIAPVRLTDNWSRFTDHTLTKIRTRL
ncbi:MAG: hypothetical protein VST68_06835, partial [Nitrospirota bacterium]|nr:hypothetical protein [Nitrospirota bacterium]